MFERADVWTCRCLTLANFGFQCLNADVWTLLTQTSAFKHWQLKISAKGCWGKSFSVCQNAVNYVRLCAPLLSNTKYLSWLSHFVICVQSCPFVVFSVQNVVTCVRSVSFETSWTWNTRQDKITLPPWHNVSDIFYLPTQSENKIIYALGLV